MERHEWLTQELASLPWYAHYLVEAIEDPKIVASGKNPCLAAAKYLVEWEDVIPDTDPQFGYVDDLFVLLYALSELLRHGGREARRIGEKTLPTGGRVADRIHEARENFPGFWGYMVQEVGGGFQDVARTLQKDPTLVPPLVAAARSYIQAASQRTVTPVHPQALEMFLRHRSARAAAKRP
jgi:uncharacterized membrane protein YkvA (DUF1232 family)